MKRIIHLLVMPGIIWSMLVQSACSDRTVNRHRIRFADQLQGSSQLNRQEEEHYVNENQFWQRDSSYEHYRVTIFPVDSFQFSSAGAFSGKASRVEVTGTRLAGSTLDGQQVVSRNRLAHQNQKDDYARDVQYDSVERVSTREQPRIFLLILSALMLAMLILLIYRSKTVRRDH